MPNVSVNGIRVYYEVEATGGPLLLISGFACDHTAWSQLVSLLAVHYRIIVFDNCGMGQTASSGNITSIRQMADDAAGLLDTLGLHAVHVAGHSMGGMIAQELALARPELVQSLMLISSTARLDVRGKEIIEAWGDLPRLLDARTGTRLILPWIYTSAFYARPDAVEQVIDQILTNPFPPRVQAIRDQSRAISACDTLDRYAGEGYMMLPT